MTAQDFSFFIHTYRIAPKPEEIGHVFTYITHEKLMRVPKTQIAMAGIVAAFCDRHPDKWEMWRKGPHAQLLETAFSILRARSAQESVQWVDALAYRWIILATDREAWHMIRIANDCPCESQRIGAQSALSKITQSFDGVPIVATNGEVVSKTDFEDLRLQILRLTREYVRMTPNERRLPFDRVPFSQETLEIQKQQAAFTAILVN